MLALFLLSHKNGRDFFIFISMKIENFKLFIFKIEMNQVFSAHHWMLLQDTDWRRLIDGLIVHFLLI